MKLREAAEMALDALHNIDQSNNYDAIEALQKALAQPDEVLAERERCAKIALTGTGEPVQVDTLKILKKERERIAAGIFEIEEIKNG